MDAPRLEPEILPGFEKIIDHAPDRERARAALERRGIPAGHVGGMADMAVFRFANGYGGWVLLADGDRLACSVATPDRPFEMAVFHADGTGDHLCFATPVTSDVLCPLDRDGVAAVLGQIRALPRRDACSHRAGDARGQLARRA